MKEGGTEGKEKINKYTSVSIDNGTPNSLRISYDTTHCRHKNSYDQDTLDVVYISNTEDGLLNVVKKTPVIYYRSSLGINSSSLIRLPCNDESVEEIVTHVKEFITKVENIDKQETEQ